MRRRRARTTFFALLAASAATALFLPRVQTVQTAAAAAFVPVSHPSYLTGRLVTGWLDADDPLDPESPGSPREVAAVYAENQQLRQQLLVTAARLQALVRLNRDRDKLGATLRDLCDPASVVGSVEGEDDQLQVAAIDGIAPSMRALHTSGAKAGVVGTVSVVTPMGARIQLITDPGHRPFDARFVRFDEQAGQMLWLDTDSFVISGAGEGLCEIARHKLDDLEENGVEPGMWAVLSDDAWPETMHGVQVARVKAIEPLPKEPGFARVLLEPSANLTQLPEVMVLVRP